MMVSDTCWSTNPPGPRTRTPEIAGLMIRAYEHHWLLLMRPAIEPLFLGGGTLGGVGWIAMISDTVDGSEIQLISWGW